MPRQTASAASHLTFCMRAARGTAQWFCLVLVLFVAGSAAAYSVLTHEEIVDLLWNSDIVPLLHRRFPSATPEDLRRAHAYAYGGSMIQDMGYYPFGSQDFSDLVHYVRSGDFVEALLRESTTLDEYAFAIGALAHYVSDNTGHPAVNHSVALMFPKLRARYGDSVTYADDPKAHIRTEFGFDVAQIAKQRYAPDAYHDFIGFEVAKPLLERAFRATYGIDLGEVFTNVDLSIGTYRRAISKVIPEMTKAALETHRVELRREIPNFDEHKFVFNLSRAAYEKDWGSGYRRPGIGARILAFLFRLIPKVGPFKAVAFETPTPQTEDLYFRSVNRTVDNYRTALKQLGAGTLQLANRDFDTGRKTVAGEYPLTDHSYAGLLHRLAKHKFQGVTPALRSELLAFFAAATKPVGTRKDREHWAQIQHEVGELRGLAPAALPVAGRTPK